jgi:hypothetical protein
MTRRRLLDTGPAFDFLFRRKGVDTRAENDSDLLVVPGLTVENWTEGTSGK